jgi:glycine/D-amino acid oxidase-like deaminating enzyme
MPRRLGGELDPPTTHTAEHDVTTTQIPPDQGRSWWLREALADERFAGDPCPPLTADTTADVVILGGGYTGMWTAWFITQLDPGADVVLLEQDICGGGPSGRNGGFVNSFWGDLTTLCERFGDDAAVRLCRAGEDSVTEIGAFGEKHGFDTGFRYDLNAASSTSQIGEWADEVITADRLGLDHLQVLSRDEVRAKVDSPVLHGGVFSRLAGTLHPARLARGLRNTLLEANVRIFEHTYVSRFGAGDPVIAETPSATVRAGAGVIAVNAWAQHWKRFRRAITVRGSYIVMTGPAPERLEEIGWTDGMGLSDYRSALHYVRTTPDGRIAFGIGGMQPDIARHIDPRFAYDESSIDVAIRDLHRMFPTFRDVPIDAGWGGPIDVSGDHLPFFGSLERGTVHYGMGYTGNGVGPSHLGGRILAHRALAKYDEVLALPVVDLEPRRFPPEPIRSVGAAVANRAIHSRDETLDDEHDPNPFVDFVAKLPRRLGYNLGP